MDFPLINNYASQEIIVIISFKKQTNKYKESSVILQSIGIIVRKQVTYTCRYSGRHLIPIIQSCPDELGPLEYLQR